jgi:hypothetical protein
MAKTSKAAARKARAAGYPTRESAPSKSLTAPSVQSSPYNISVTYNPIGGTGGSAGIVRGTPADWFGPLNPLTPIAPPEVAGRRFDYPSGYNISTRPRAYEPISFEQLRGLADGYDLMRLVIETRKDQMARLRWTISPRETDGPANGAKAKKKIAGDTRIATIKQFFKRPDGEQKWGPWVRQLLEDMFVIDAPTLFVRRNRGGKMMFAPPGIGDPRYGLAIVDGATIKRVIDDWGRTPMPFTDPASGEIVTPPAYQQNLKGFPAVNYTIRDIYYRPRNLRSNKVYGLSPVEQVIMTVNIALRRQVSQLQYYCYSDDTEVMTKRGWLRFADTNADDEFATRQIGVGKFEWQRAYDTFRKHYTGQMIRFVGKSIDMLVTPHHRMLVNSLPRGIGDNRNYRAEEHVVTAEQLAAFGTNNTGIPLTSTWAGTEIGSRIFTGNDPRTKPVEMTGDDYCAFMGMYLAEGNLHHKGSIAISQPPDARGAHQVFGDLMCRLFGTGVCYSGHQFEVCRTALADFLRQFGKAHEKFIPDDIREATPRQLAIFLRHYLLGDGRAKGDDGVSTQQGFTVSRRLADHLTEIGQKLGYAPAVWTRKGAPYSFGDRGGVSREEYLISFARMKATKGWHAESVDYDAPVSCVCVPNKFLYVRRNGKAAWSGNTEGNVPEALIGVSDQWTPGQIADFQLYWDTINEGDTAQRRHAKFISSSAAKTFIPIKEPELKNTFDEWLARVVCFCFSISSQPFVSMMNRATAETSQTAALEEGLAPVQEWLKDFMDEVIEQEFAAPDLEFRWEEEEEIDPESLEKIINGRVAGGRLTINQGREAMGMDPYAGQPAADQPMVMTPTGFFPIDANTLDGKKAAMDLLGPPAAPGGGFGDGGGNEPPPDGGKTPPAGKKPAPKGPKGKTPPAKPTKKAADIDALFKIAGYRTLTPIVYDRPAVRSAVRDFRQGGEESS